MNNSGDVRLAQIHQWLESILPEQPYLLTPASSDASFRRYFRVQQAQQSWIIMDAPPEHEDIEPFIEIGRFLQQHRVAAPIIFDIDYYHGFIRLSDLGNTAYLSALKHNNADILYKAAIDTLIAMQSAPLTEITLPAYDRNLLMRELELFPKWFLQRHFNLPVPAFLQQTFELLIANAQSQPQLFVHRDYHSRNLMLLASGQPGVIDFQDAVVGPASYDLVSLLRDVYIEWPQQQIDQWLAYYYEQAIQVKLLQNVSLAQFTEWFDLMGLQRHIKILGIFCRLNYRDNKSDYMNDLALTMKYVRTISARYPQLAELHQFVSEHPQLKAV